jgi:integrase
VSNSSERQRRNTAVPVRDPETGTWGFVVDVGRDPSTGKRRQVRRRGLATKRAAQAELDALRQSGRDSTYVRKTRESVREYLIVWLQTIEPTLKPSTHYSYGMKIRTHVLPRIGGLQLQAVDGGTLNTLYADMATAGAAPRSVRYVHAILHRAFRDAARIGHLTRNPCDQATPPKASATPRKPIVTWSAEQVRTFLRHAAEEDNRNLALWTLLCTTGMRRGEALGLRWIDVDVDEKVASITQTIVQTGRARWEFGSPKSAAGSRTIDLDPTTVAALTEHRKSQLETRMLVGPRWSDHGLVFARETGEPIDPARASRDFTRAVKRAGVPMIRLHDTRHTWATLALKAGVPVKVVQERLGHSSPAITQALYQHVVPGMQRDAAGLVASMIFGA